MRIISFIFLFQLIVVATYAQKPTQSIQGYVYDAVSKKPVAGVEVYLQATDPLKGASTKSDGTFTISDVPVGRYVLIVRHVGFKKHHEEILVEGSRPLNIKVAFEHSYSELQPVIVVEKPFITDPAQVGKQHITIEQTKRLPANYHDPARVMIILPGIAPQNDQNNNLIVNGKSPNGMLWRVEGMDVLNPNHLSNAGTLSDRPMAHGGGVNILSTQMLGQTDFVTAPFDAGYGNVLSAGMSMNFRPGDKHQHGYTAQASLIGLDLAAEGPLKKGRSSFLANYRYSTVGLLSSMGVDFGGEEINFQDLSFHLSFDQKKGGQFSLFGYSGSSNNDFEGVGNPDEWEVDKDSTKINYSSASVAVGLKEVLPVGKKSSFTIGSVFSALENERTSHGIDREGVLSLAENYTLEQLMLSSKVEFKGRDSGGSELTTGVMMNYKYDHIKAEELFTGSGALAEGSGEGVLFQPYFSFKTRFTEQWLMEAGLRYMYYTFNKTASILPVIQFSYSADERNVINVHYGRQSQLQVPEIYFSENNQHLEMNKMHHLGIGHSHIFDNTLLISKLFYQTLYDIPVSITLSSFSIINQLNSYVPGPLISEGTGEVYGLNLSYERPIRNDLYYVLSGALYESNYKGTDGIERSSRFNGNYTISLTGGKELVKEKENNSMRVIGINGRIFYAGGLRKMLVSEELSQSAMRTIYIDDQVFTESLKDYFRIDFRISFRKEKSNYTRVFAIDIQNLLSIENDAFEYYDFRMGKVVVKKQLGIIPILVYRIEF